MTLEQKHVRQRCESPLVILGVSAAVAVVIGVLPKLWGHSPALATSLALVLVAAFAITVKYAPNRK
ncbi:hypothetical protein BBK82_18695 [Lentzea guizhouensis]|uniref:Uncharacterized protein n=1 Tax=Lentzea guizhouensis TaxID=1586287 RepID=A0A1B2HJA3_9PSEU|nr:hypothetical protein [Lentzea guizhouensis]ANZ37789.1 hypothetical protein BBK82_18695 [Lentzea guizhouensis]